MMVDKISNFLMQFFVVLAVAAMIWSFMPKSLHTVNDELKEIRRQLEELNRILKERTR